MSVFHNNALIGAGGGAAAAEAAVATKSLRFNSGDSAHLSKTFSSAGNRKKWTWSAWVKLCSTSTGRSRLFGSSGSNTGSPYNFATDIGFKDNKISFANAANDIYLTDAVLRDYSAWYHIVVALDTTDATTANRVKIYVNGVLQDKTHGGHGGAAEPSQNTEYAINSTDPHNLGATPNTSGTAISFLDGYMADIYFIDGSALDATSFGAYDDNGVWQAAVYSGTYGTNGFHLAFGNSSSSAALGTDSSGNSNTFTVNNISGDAVGLSTANQGFDVVTYTGNGSTQSISGLSFGAAPDFVWIKQRNTTKNHGFYDVVRGATKRLASNLTNSEATDANLLTSFDSNGFSLGNDSEVNENNGTYVAWCWKAGGTASSNTDGTITSSVSANTTYGFSVVGYTGNNTSGATVGHGLSSAPKWIVVKSRDQTGQFWHVYHASLDADEYAYLNNSNAVTSGNDFMNGTRPTSSVFSLGNGNGCNKSGDNVIAYCWAEVSGFSKISSYNGSGGAATKVVTGFRPRYIIARPINDSNGNRWHIVDTERGVGGSAERLFAEDSGTFTARQEVLIENDGFVVTNTTTDSGSLNRNTEYIYAAFASKPTGEDIDSLFDVPTNDTENTDSGAGGEVSANYATWNPLSSATTLSNGNLDSNGTGGHNQCLATIGMSSGKWYFETTIVDNTENQGVGIALKPEPGTFIGNTTSGYLYYGNGTKRHSTTNTVVADSFTDGDVVGIAFDADAGNLYFYKNGVAQISGSAAFTGLTSGPYFFTVDQYDTSAEIAANFGQREFVYDAPTNYKALCTKNLPTPTIADGSDYFDTALYTGDGASSRALTPYSFSPDFVWIKDRSQAFFHELQDTVRGAGKRLSSDSNAAEDTSNQTLTAFSSTGFTVNFISGFGRNTNENNDAYVAWAWDAGSSTASNTDGSITSSVRASAASGFSIVTWTGNGSSSASVGHSLNTEPSIIIIKCRSSATDWHTYVRAIDPNGRYQVYLNKTDGKTDFGSNFFSGSSSVINLNSSSLGINGNGSTYVAYCFAPVAGFSHFTSFEGTGSSDPVFVHCGFRPAWIMKKNIDTGSTNWYIHDTARDTFNVCDAELKPNSGAAENTFTALDILSNGFAMRTSNSNHNGSGDTYIVAAFAENPFSSNGGLAR